jgi:hypothetical protein
VTAHARPDGPVLPVGGLNCVSEYQYYEFLAVDRSLDERQLAELRTLSSPARITATTLIREVLRCLPSPHELECLQAGELEDHDLEPPVPANLTRLTPSLRCPGIDELRPGVGRDR